jgi:hypothetical protein
MKTGIRGDTASGLDKGELTKAFDHLTGTAADTPEHEKRVMDLDRACANVFKQKASSAGSSAGGSSEGAAGSGVEGN